MHPMRSRIVPVAISSVKQLTLSLLSELMAAVQYVVEGGSTLSGTIRPSGNKNAALPIVAAALLCEEPVTLENVPRIRDVETLVELIKSAGVLAEWKQRNTLLINA